MQLKLNLGGVVLSLRIWGYTKVNDNAMLSFVYMLLRREVAFALEAVSLAPAVSRTAGICAGFDGGTARSAVRSFCLDYVPPEAAVERPIRPR